MPMQLDNLNMGATLSLDVNFGVTSLQLYSLPLVKPNDNAQPSVAQTDDNDDYRMKTFCRVNKYFNYKHNRCP